jgi:hypothetical protein
LEVLTAISEEPSVKMEAIGSSKTVGNTFNVIPEDGDSRFFQKLVNTATITAEGGSRFLKNFG